MMTQVAKFCTHIYSYKENENTVTFECILCKSKNELPTSEAAAFKKDNFMMIRKELGA